MRKRGVFVLVPLERYTLYILSIFDFTNFDKHVLLLIALVLLIFLSSYFTLIETAYSSVNIVKLRNHVEGKRKGAKKAVYIAEKYEQTLTTTEVGRNLVNIAAIALFSYFINQVVLNSIIAIIIAIFFMLVLLLIFGEFIPKSYSKENAELVALQTSGIFFIIIKILFPLTWIFLKLKKLLFKRGTLVTPYITEDELESIIDVMEYEGVIEKDSADILQSAISLSEITVYDIMTPRVDIVAVDIDDDIEDIKQMFFENKYSRVPVYDDDIDNVLGVLTERDFLTAYITKGPENISLNDIIIKPNFISTLTKVDELIRDMQELKYHLAIVTDEYGGTSGIVTMEDALEVLVGEIYDESDEYNESEDPEKLNKIGENKYRISADMDLEYLFDELELTPSPAPESRYSSVGGFVYKLIDDLSHEGQQVSYPINSIGDDSDENFEYSLLFTIEKIYNRRIKTITIELIKKPIEEAEAETTDN